MHIKKISDWFQDGMAQNHICMNSANLFLNKKYQPKRNGVLPINIYAKRQGVKNSGSFCSSYVHTSLPVVIWLSYLTVKNKSKPIMLVGYGLKSVYT